MEHSSIHNLPKWSMNLKNENLAITSNQKSVHSLLSFQGERSKSVMSLAGGAFKNRPLRQMCLNECLIFSFSCCGPESRVGSRKEEPRESGDWDTPSAQTNTQQTSLMYCTWKGPPHPCHKQQKGLGWCVFIKQEKVEKEKGTTTHTWAEISVLSTKVVLALLP